MGDGKQYGCSRDFAASVGLVPRQYSTGGKTSLPGISRRGDKTVRRLLVLCARAYMRCIDKRTGRLAEWVRAMLARRQSNVVACARANKLARTAWAIVARHTTFDAVHPASSRAERTQLYHLRNTHLVLRRLKIDDVNGTPACGTTREVKRLLKAD
jgi:Transposase IS116/IS110/IS902 family